jgi:uncharacterized protein (DUF1697 family)
MATYIALLRGVNVGGRNKLPMKEWTDILKGFGAEEIKTYIQSGNAVFRHRALRPAEFSRKVASAIEKRHGFAPHVLLLKSAEMKKAIDANPYAKAESNPHSLHVYFLDAAPKTPDLESLENIRLKNERFALKNQFFYLLAPDGIGRSKLAARVEKALGVAATARNWRTVSKVMEMARELG